jgi:hypothetical protein
MADSVETAIQNDLAAILKALHLADMAAANVGRIREAPKVGERIDQLPCVLICPRGQKPPEGLSFEGAIGIGYVEEVIVIDGREGDLATDQPKTQLWKEQCVSAVAKSSPTSWRTTLPNVPTVYDLRVGDIEGYDRTKLDDNYAYLSFFVTVRSSE